MKSLIMTAAYILKARGPRPATGAQTWMYSSATSTF